MAESRDRYKISLLEPDLIRQVRIAYRQPEIAKSKLNFNVVNYTRLRNSRHNIKTSIVLRSNYYLLWKKKCYSLNEFP